MKIEFKNGLVTISINPEALVNAFNNNPKTEDVNEDGDFSNYRVTNKDEFISEIVMELNKECPDTGLNTVHRMLDNCFNELLESGALGVSEDRVVYE